MDFTYYDNNLGRVFDFIRLHKFYQIINTARYVFKK